MALLGPVVLPSTRALAGAWVQPVGGHYAKCSLLGLSTDERRGPEGESLPADPGGAYAERQIFLYGEWGWTREWTVVASWAWKDMEIQADPGWGTRSGGDLRLGLRRGLVQGPTALALEGVLSLPTYPASDLTRPPGRREQNLPAGSGQVEGELRLLAGRSLHPLPLYGGLDLGYRARGGGFADLWMGSLEVGASGRDLFAKVELRALRGRDASATDSAAVGDVAFTESSLKVGGEGALRLGGGFWLGIGFSSLLEGENTLAGTQWNVALVHQSGGS